MDFKNNFSDFRNYLIKDLAYNIDTESLRAIQFEAWGVVLLFTLPGQNRGKPKFLDFMGKFLKSIINSYLTRAAPLALN